MSTLILRVKLRKSAIDVDETGVISRTRIKLHVHKVRTKNERKNFMAV